MSAGRLKVRRSGTDKKWEEMSSLLQNHAEMFDAQGHRRKMVIFSEHRDTLNYLTERLRSLLGAPEALVTIANLVPAHLDEVRKRREDLVTRTMAAVKDRLTKETTYWDHRANQLKDQELAGKTNAKINSGKARQRADELQARLQRRMAELELERQIAPLPPVTIRGSLVVPIGVLRKLLRLPHSQAMPPPTLYRRKPERRWSCLPCRWSWR